MNGNDYNDRLAEYVRFYSNILDEKSLRSTMDILALYILVWEAFKKMVIELLREFYCSKFTFLDEGKVKISESREYKRKVRSKDKNILLASLKWFLESQVISEAEVEKILKFESGGMNLCMKWIRFYSMV